MSNLIAAVNAIPALDELNSGLVNGDQLDLGEILSIPTGDGELYWDHAISRTELLSSALKHGKEPDALALRRHLGNIARSLGSDDQANATWIDEDGKTWKISARQYDVSDSHCIRAIYADESGETDHELIELADCETLGEWLESAAMVNGELTLS